MSQQSVLDFLREHKDEDRWWSTKEMSKEMDVSRGSVTNNISKLRKHLMVKFREQRDHYNWYEYRWKDDDE